MHIQICIEDSSGREFLDRILPKIFSGLDVTWNAHGYGGIGRLPANLSGAVDVKKRTLLDQLPKLIRGCVNTPYIEALVIVVDSDKRDPTEFLAELNSIAKSVGRKASVLFALAIEEMEAWYLGDQEAIMRAYSDVKISYLSGYQQDSICGTWEWLAEAIIPGGLAKIKADGWPASGIIKAEWAKTITPHMDPERNMSPSFISFKERLKGLVVRR